MGSATSVPGATAPSPQAAVTRIPRHSSQSEIDELCINTVRCLSMDAVQKAKSGHPGMPMGAAPMGYLLYTKYLRCNPANPEWVNRDRFVLSAGHGCMLLYSLLHLTGYDLSLDEIRNFRQWGSRTPGHPEYGHTPGVELTTGPLGQGISSAVGMAIAEKYLSAYFNRDGFPVIDYRIFVIAGDGCLQEGVSSEACSLAGHLGLNNLVVLYDDNRITIDGPTALSFSEDAGLRYESYGWRVQTVEDGNDLAAISKALTAALEETSRPSLIKVRTHIGFGSPGKQDSAEAHGAPLGEEEVARTKQRYGWDPSQHFVVPDAVRDRFREARSRGAMAEAQWSALVDRYAAAYPDLAREFRHAATRSLPEHWTQLWSQCAPVFDGSAPIATREASGKLLDALMPRLPLVVGGSADLTPSNNTRWKGAEDFSRENRLGRYIRYGVREHAMGAIINGMAVTDLLIPFAGTFLTFSDYMRPALRLAAMSRYPAIFVYTHDSIGLGEDGPTHQPVEHFAAIRTFPGMVFLRPADANETVQAWKFALERRDGPTAIALTRQKVPVISQTAMAPASGLLRGAYVLLDALSPRVILIATGSEVHLAVQAHEKLATLGVASRVVSMPSWELFEQQTREYRDSVLPPGIAARVVVEAGIRLGWDRYMGDRGRFVGMSSFGASAPAEVVFRQFGITVDAIVGAAQEVIG